MKHIRHIFFDLDHTLWDFNRCSEETLTELFTHFHSHIGLHHDFNTFFDLYRRNNEMLWQAYERSEINTAGIRVKRWELTFGEMEVSMGDWSEEMAQRYINECPRKTHVMPKALETLDYLKESYDLHMITNGWWDNQITKLTHSGLKDYFGKIITSDRADAKKPQKEIFDFALRESGADRDACVYIGDSYTADVIGGSQAGWDVIFFNPHQKPNPEKAPEIAQLAELIELF